MDNRREWKSLPSDTAAGPVAVPARLDHRAFLRHRLQGELQTGTAAAGVDRDVAVARRRGGFGEPDTELRCGALPHRVDIDQGDIRFRDAAKQTRDAAADRSRTDHDDPVADARCRVPTPRSARSPPLRRARRGAADALWKGEHGVPAGRTNADW